ncbi:ferredoxin-thioredoxin reductase catalytic chain, chloroplastic-like isoform X3 [Hordeum vulgare subsp. vulgare]|uniref:ferredoxin-thioredoxin reductase catalytic chain, chloroplastic-like isoform X3 n=1 Tax=Hordeum vulgare subsp. vulgare TaxID=112509 RepID=UPI001D1A5973|nr:ferredoxin-thioredoxin reductase catalytic chain, chloroplastic-like isoform X3 [Hordeum vulgare subsp. vulgare]
MILRESVSSSSGVRLSSRLIPLSSPLPHSTHPWPPPMMSITSTAGTLLCPPPVSRGGWRGGSARRRGSGGFVRAEVCGDNAQVLGAVRPQVQHLLLLRQVCHRHRHQEKTSFLHGLADHKDQFGAPLCPCRHYDDKAAEPAQDFWNCPCVPMRERRRC